ncbi:hypothetical protein [Peribacillus sp. Hz7]|uniref:hypothetical protein n=1 Tax=Peribacillus sp. Hz7 TaxID=3344873 RepID=UPI0035C98367
MKRYFICILSFLLVFTFTSTTFAASKFTLTKQWTYKVGESSLPEKWIYHVTKNGSAFYIMGTGTGYAKMIILSPKGKKVWSTELREFHGVSKKDTLYVLDENMKNIIEINEQGKKISSIKYSDKALKNLTIVKPNMENWDREPSKKIVQTLEKTKLPAFIKDKKGFEKKYGKGASYYSYYTAESQGSTVYILANYSITGTKAGKESSSHSVLFTFSKSGKYLSQKDLGDYHGADIDVSTKENIYVSLNKRDVSKPYAIIKVLNKKNSTLKEIKLSEQSIWDGKLYKDKLYIVSDKYFYMYK